MKIAIALNGFVGNSHGKADKPSEIDVLEHAYLQYFYHIVCPNTDLGDEVDFFVHTWDIGLEDEIEDLYKPVKSSYEVLPDFAVPSSIKGNKYRLQGHYGMWKSRQKVLGLVNQHVRQTNTEYDYVMLLRFDLSWQNDLVFSDYDPFYFWTGNLKGVRSNGTYIDFPTYISHPEKFSNLSYMTIGWPGNVDCTTRRTDKKYPGFNDLWFFSNRGNMSKFGELFNNLDQYLRNPVHRQITSNHSLVQQHLEHKNILQHTRLAFNLIDDFPLVRWHVYHSGK